MIEPPRLDVGGHINVDGPYSLDQDDIPENYLPVIGRKRVLSRIQLEGHLTPSDQSCVDEWLGQVIRETKGVLIDLQTDRFETPTRSGLLEADHGQPESLAEMAFYFEDGEKFYESGFADVLGECARIMPEALPVKFGYYEPLQGRIKGDDFSELVSSFKQESSLFFMQAKSPFGHISLNVPCKKTFEKYGKTHFTRRKFLLGHLRFDLRPSIFRHPVKLAKLQSLFEQICVALDVVYAEITDRQSRNSWLWYGLPDNQPRTICVGRRYQEVWPDISGLGYSIAEHQKIISTDRFGKKPPRPPQDLIAPAQPDLSDPRHRDTRDIPPNYAATFPFNFQFDPNNYIW
ncbi:hypothetical protein [Erythrobacter mangrovi]|uniref:Uncharacterized protein n=1 Tax=Erythrobacter mangrovi TaxID=2739433 RepID=A0A7D3XPQ6_9SPHN|nr:hypothetical protein [Erythrobacter mangrovi]QKG70031.1 hypothetical protein HQR01_00835 [Erythrobacter mangrovi]